MAAISLTFSLSGLTATAKLLCFGDFDSLPAGLATGVRSLKLEHVSPGALVHQEICRGTPLGQQAQQARRHGSPVPDPTLLAIVRKWFWARKPDAGFLLSGFPATLLHARVFDEWLEAREEDLSGCLCADASTAPAVVEHYRALGLPIAEAAAAVPAPV